MESFCQRYVTAVVWLQTIFDCGSSTCNDSLYFSSICVNLNLPPNPIQGFCAIQGFCVFVFSVYSNDSDGAARNLNLPPNLIQGFCIFINQCSLYNCFASHSPTHSPSIFDCYSTVLRISVFNVWIQKPQSGNLLQTGLVLLLLDPQIKDWRYIFM